MTPDSKKLREAKGYFKKIGYGVKVLDGGSYGIHVLDNSERILIIAPNLDALWYGSQLSLFCVTRIRTGAMELGSVV